MSTSWAAVAETHTAALFFAGDRVYKVKKPVALGFLDFSTIEARRRACENEVRLNRRLAPDVYLGVGWVGLGDQDAEPAVVMRRLPADRNLAHLAGTGEPLRRATAAVARALAAFHERVPVVGRDLPASSWPDPADRWRQDAAEVLALVRGSAREPRVRQIAELGERYAAHRGALFRSREVAGRVRDGHGDLQADDIFLLEDGPRILDCLEFDDALRVGDVQQDAAFLAMDLERLGRLDLAHDFLVTYQAAAGDYDAPPSLLHFYIAHRALVRAKVALIRSGQPGAPDRSDCDDYLTLALGHLREAQLRLVMIGGLPGSGKTTASRRWASRLSATRLNTDEIRKTVTGGRPARAPYGTGAYTTQGVDAVYDELLCRAEQSLAAGRSVVLDASWHAARHRERARRLAERTGAAVSEVQLVIDDTVAEQRLRWRRNDASDADAATRRRMRADFDPWPESTVPTDAALHDRTFDPACS